MKSNKLKFRPRARIIRTIGDRLISGPVAAIIELVKNAHDADAPSIMIKFIPSLEQGKGRIVIEDDGHGMTFEDIRTKWMEPATDSKTNKRHTPKGRLILGSKGIGRFAASRLGDTLTLETVSEDIKTGKYFKTTIKKIDWNIFDRTEYLDEVSFDCSIEETSERSGTRLTIEDLRDEWGAIRLSQLNNELRKMILPVIQQSDLSIYLDLNECTQQTSGFYGAQIVNPNISLPLNDIERWKISPLPLLNACDYEVSGSFDEAGNFEGTLEIKRGNLKPEKLKINAPKYIPGIEKSCGQVLVHFYIFDRDRSSIEAMAKRAGKDSKQELTYKEARILLNDMVGVAIYRDNYRVRPYGDREHDWLELDKRRVQNPTMNIGHDLVSGIIIVEDEKKSGLIERSSREGFEETPEFSRLKNIVSELFRTVIGPRRYAFRKETRPEKQENYSFNKIKIMAKLAWVDRILEKIPQKQRDEISLIVGDERSKLIAYVDKLEEKHAILEAKVTLGQIVAEVIHDGSAAVHFIKIESSRLTKWLSIILEDTKEAEEKRADIPRILRGLYVSTDVLSSLFSSLRPLALLRRGQPRIYDPSVVIHDTINLFDWKLKEYRIKASVSNPENIIEAYGYRQDLQTAFTNLFDNSIYWLSYREMRDPEIEVSLFKEGKKLVILVSDNGPGIPEGYKETIFDVGFSLKENGSGLGLAIAREAVSRSNGELFLVPSKQGVTFKIEVPAES